LNAEQAIVKAKGLKNLPEDEQRILIEEAQEYRSFRSHVRPKHLLERNDDSPQTIHDEAMIS